MPATRSAAFRLVDRGLIEVTQKGQVVQDLMSMKGPIRLRLRSQPDTSEEGAAA